MHQEKIINISINDLIPNQYQPRNNFDEKALNELTNSIKQYGILNPILVRTKDNKYEIIAGERRYRAAKKAGLTEVPVIIKNVKEEDLAELALIENLHRENLNPIEEAKSYQEIMKTSNMTQQSLGEKLGKSQAFIANKLRILSLPNQIQEALVNKKISERHARSLMKVSDQKRQQELLERIINEKLTVKDLDTIINEKEITEAEIKSAIDDIMKSLNIPVEKDKKEEKESDNMNGNFFPNYNNQMGVNENASLNSMNMQSMNSSPIQQAPETVMPSPSIAPMPEVLPPVGINSIQEQSAPQMMDTPLFAPQFDTPQVEQPMEAQSMGPAVSLSQPNLQPVDEFAQPVIQQSPEIVMPSPSIAPMPEVLPQVETSIQEQPVPQMMDTPLFTNQFDTSQNIGFEPAINIPEQPIVGMPTQVVDNNQSLYDVPVNTPTASIVEEDKATKVMDFLNQNGIAYKSYSNETNKCIIIEL